MNPFEIEISGSFFINNTASLNGILHFLNALNYIKITKSLFKNNSAQQGGGIYYENLENC